MRSVREATLQVYAHWLQIHEHRSSGCNDQHCGPFLIARHPAASKGVPDAEVQLLSEHCDSGAPAAGELAEATVVHLKMYMLLCRWGGEQLAHSFRDGLGL